MHVDVLVLNAAIDSPAQTMFELGTAAVWAQFEANVKGPLQFAETFYKQSNPAKSKKYLINVSSAVIHFRGHPLFDLRPTYSLTKTSETLAIQMLADTISVDEMQILSIHPGMLYTEPLAAQGVPEDAFPWDDGESRRHSRVFWNHAAADKV
jgi:NAD(P)-dependent dehydrogenase (short-subunit alcohol dehydrogenase family)